MMFKSLDERLSALRKKEISYLEQVNDSLKKIKQHQELNAFISLDEEEAIKQARLADEDHAKRDLPPLFGIPIAHKDLFCTTKLPTTCGSKMLATYVSPFDATVVTNLKKAGTIMMGKTNMDEFAMGSSSETSFFGPVKNPWNLAHVAGGSSGGSAAAVAAGLVPLATASDTGGSVRQPAAFCGVSGIKPSYGLASRYGMVAYASSMDQAGLMARSAEDLSLGLRLMAGFDPKDSTSIDRSIPDYSQALTRPIKGLRIGIPQSFFPQSLDPLIEKTIYQALKIFEEAGAHLIEIELTRQEFWIPCYYMLACAEASSNLARYDGLRYGHRSKNQGNLQELISSTRDEAFGDEVKKRILTGTFVLSSGYFSAYYLQALKVRRLIQAELQETLKKVDLIAGPTTPTTAFKLGARKQEPSQFYLGDIFTVAANLAGLPALSIPAGFSQGLPLGLQFMGAMFSEDLLLNVAHHYQLRTDWHLKRPFGEDQAS